MGNATLRHTTWRLATRATQVPARATAGLRPLPDFLIIGAQRAGTTSLHHYLGQHPGVLGPRLTKGVHWFDEHFDRSEAWYRSHYPTQGKRRWVEWRRGMTPVVGEASPYYMFHPFIPARIAESLPNAKLIVILRDPVKRAWSHYLHNVDRDMEPLSFADALAAEPGRLAGAQERMIDPAHVDFGHRHGSYVARGRYLDQLERVWAAVGEDRVLVLFSDELNQEPERTLAEVHRFLGLEPRAPEVAKRWHQQPPDAVAPDIEAELRRTFAPHDAALAERLGRRLPWQSPR